ncbi:hypothetical protein Syun_026807 [Stephania yunnanensis]|uniref:FRIGIDA-like protein n=1 Tax=Stephania yunnanensis TaxID=152371 RepID=A0AAP0EEG5_9MAGN
MASNPPNSSPIPSMEKISDALKAIEPKKQSLREALEHLQAHSSSLASFTLQWKDLEDHFNSVQKSLEERFKALESKEKLIKSGESIEPIAKSIEKASILVKKEPILGVKDGVLVDSELKSICVKMDGNGLRAYVMRKKERKTSKEDVSAALKWAPDAAKLVLDAMQGFYVGGNRKERGGEAGACKRACVMILEGLLAIAPEIGSSVKAEARKLSLEWKKDVSAEGQGEDQLEALAFLLVVGIYGLTPEFDGKEILELLVSVARRKQAVDMSLALNCKELIPELVQRLCSNGRQIDAVKFIFAFELVDKIPPVPLLQASLKEAKKVAHEVRQKGNNSLQSQNEAIAREIAYLKAIIKRVEEHQLESQFPRENLDKRIEQLEKLKASKKRAAAAAIAPAPASTSASNLQQKQKLKQKQQLIGNKRPRVASSNHVDLAVPPVLAPSPQMLPPPSLLSDQYLSSSAHYKAFPGTIPDAPHYSLVGAPSSASHYSLAGAPSNAPNYNFAGADTRVSHHGFPGAASDSAHHLSAQHLTSGLYDRSLAYGSSRLYPSSYSSSYYR